MVANIWVAASDGDLDVVKAHIASGNFSPNSKDPNGYTPIHAAVSYGHIDLLQYLIEQGGDINVQDTEGDTPLHHVEDSNTSKLLVEKYKADWKIKNHDGQIPADYVEEDGDFPEVVQYLRSLNHDNPNNDNENKSSHILDSLPIPTDVSDHKIRYSYENEGDLTIDIDDAKRQQLKEIVEGENPEEKLSEFLKDAVHKQFYSEDGQESASSKKRRD
jgi:ankyrin repeat protein